MIWKRALLFVFCIATLAVPGFAWLYWPTRLPHPDQCSQNQLFRWIALREVSSEPLEVQRALVARFQEMLLADSSLAHVDVDPDYRAQVDRNRHTLQALWFSDCVESFGELAGSERGAFLDRQIQTAVNWQSMISRGEDDSGADSTSRIAQAVTYWIESANGEEDCRRITTVLGAAVLRWLSTGDLATMTKRTRGQVARELFDHLQRAETAAAVGDTLDLEPAGAEQLKTNGKLLLEAWFVEQARLYSELSESERSRFVSDNVTRVRQSPLVPLLLNRGGAPTAANPLAQLLMMRKMIQEWIKRADESDRRMLQDFASAVYREVFSQALSRSAKTSRAAGTYARVRPGSALQIGVQARRRVQV